VKTPAHLIFITSLLVLPAAWAGSEIEQDEAQALRQQGAILPLEKIISAAQHFHKGRIMEVELKHKHSRYVYEIELVDQSGKVWELKIDASDASLISQERDD